MYSKNAQLQKTPFVQVVKLAVQASTYLNHVIASEPMIRFARLVIRVNQERTYQPLALELRMPYALLAEFVVRGVTYLPHAAAPRTPCAFKSRKIEAEELIFVCRLYSPMQFYPLKVIRKDS